MPGNKDDKTLSAIQADRYSKKNIVSEKEIEIVYSDRTKIIKEVTYKCGTKKRSLVEVVKKGKKRKTQKAGK